MSLSTVSAEELIERFAKLSDQFNEVTKEIGPSLEKMGRLSKEMTIIKEELERRDG